MNQIDQGCHGGPRWQKDGGLAWAVDVGRKHPGLGLEGFRLTGMYVDGPSGGGIGPV